MQVRDIPVSEQWPQIGGTGVTSRQSTYELALFPIGLYRVGHDGKAAAHRC